MKSLLLHDEFVVQHRAAKPILDPRRAYAAIWEEERDANGALAPTAVVFLTNKECPFRCVMCDLWVNTLDATVPRGAIATQIRAALSDLPAANQIKLYNAGSFFDPAAIPPDDDDEIAKVVQGFERVIVEAHPAFLAGAYRDRCLRFRDAIGGQLEVAIGLETSHPEVLARLNKKMTLETFRRATDFLREHDLDCPGCLVLDVCMPEVTGLDLQLELAASGVMRPIVFVTAHYDQRLWNRAMTAGAVAVLPKPARSGELLSAIQEALRKDAVERGR